MVYEGVRFKFAKVSGPGDATFIAIDSNDKPYLATNEGYWGPGSGFAIAAQYNETTEWKVTFDQAGTYEFEVSLIYAPDGEVVAGITERVTVEVLPEEPEAKAMTVEPATGATIKEGQTIIVTAEGADDLRVMLWAKGIGSVEEARLAYDEKYSARVRQI
ncbi:MAG: hypothetical protein ACOX4T_10945 [Acetivibrionales bacterium]